MRKIFLFREDDIGFALAEDGSVLRFELEHAIYHRQGLTNRLSHSVYEDYFPEGYELVDLLDAEDPHAEVAFAEAYERNQSATTPVRDETSEGTEG